jgi:hypothetical protein
MFRPITKKNPAQLHLRRVSFFTGSLPDPKAQDGNQQRSRRNQDHPLAIVMHVQLAHLRSLQGIAARKP